MLAFATLLTPLAYIRIRHPLKKIVDTWFPLTGFSLAAGWVYIWPGFNLFGSSGLVVGINGLLQILVGFFITSLAAVATFNGSVYRIDEVFDGEKALLDGDALTRRQFLCFLFAYLALVSLFIYILGAFSIASASTMHYNVLGYQRDIIRLGFACLYATGISHVLGTTLIGLIFLSGRIPRAPERKRFVATAKEARPGANPAGTALNTPATPVTPDLPAPP